jgi:hypothetical protein
LGNNEVPMWFILAGGFPMIVILIVGVIALVGAARFAMTPVARRLPYLGALALAVAATSFAGTCADLLTVSVKVPAHPEMASNENLPLILLVGFGESLTPAILGAAIVAVVALLVAVGLRRLPA